MTVGETLFVRCFECRRPFPAPRQVDRTSLEAMVIDVEYRCPHCGAIGAFTKADHWFELVVER